MTVPEAIRTIAWPSPDDVTGVMDRAADVAVDDGAAAVAVAVHDTPIGPLGLAGTTPGLVAVSFDPVEAFMVELADRVSPRVVRSSRRLDSLRFQLDEYFGGSRTAFDVALDWRLSHGFRADVLHVLVEVGYGDVVSYQELARRSGRPKASRAVGSAMATNPIPIIVPCHRVVRTGGGLGGYAGGLDAKRYLLDLEGSLPG